MQRACLEGAHVHVGMLCLEQRVVRRHLDKHVDSAAGLLRQLQAPVPRVLKRLVTLLLQRLAVLPALACSRGAPESQPEAARSTALAK